MALRSEACAALFVLTAAGGWAQPYEFKALQKRLWRDKPATIRIDANGIAAERQGDARKWAWDDIQQLTLTHDVLRVLTYTDSKWRGGRDREWTFEQLPKGQAEAIYPFLRELLDARFIPALAITPAELLWELPVKHREGFGGSEGTLLWGVDSVAYRSSDRDQSRTWRIKDIEGISSSGPFDLTITTAERQGLWRGGPSDFHFQLKRPMTDDRYEAIWRHVFRSRQPETLQTYRRQDKQ